jgi:Protein of unknown function (DUF2905)
MQAVIRALLIGGVTLLVIGGLLFLLGRFNIPIGHFPGDIYIKGRQGSFYFPLTTCILISVILTILFNVFLRLFKK